MEASDVSEPFAAETERALAVYAALQQIEDAAWEEIQRQQLQRDIMQDAVASCLSACQAMLEMTHVHGEQQASGPSESSSWQPDPEPAPCLPDTWMRGVLPVRQLQPSPGVPDGQASRALPRTHTSAPPPEAGGRVSQDPLSLSTHRRSRTSSQSGGTVKEGSSSGPSAPGTTAKTPRAPGARPLIKKSSTQEVEERLREEVLIRRAQLAKQRDLAAQDEEERQRLDTLQKQLRGREYSYDHKGQVVVLNSVDPEALPSTAAGPTVTLQSSSDHKNRPGAKPAQPGGQASAPDGAVTGRHRAALVAEGPDYLEDRKETQPPVTDAIKLTSGCTIRAGQVVQQGPRRVPAPEYQGRVLAAHGCQALTCGDNKLDDVCTVGQVVACAGHMTKRDLARHLAKAAKAAEAISSSSAAALLAAAPAGKAGSRPGSQRGRPASRRRQKPQAMGIVPEQAAQPVVAAGVAAVLLSAAMPAAAAAPVQAAAAAPVQVAGAVAEVADSRSSLPGRSRGRQRVGAAPQKPPTPDANVGLVLNASDWGSMPALSRKVAPAVLPAVHDDITKGTAKFNLRDATVPKTKRISLPVPAGLRQAQPTPHVGQYIS